MDTSHSVFNLFDFASDESDESTKESSNQVADSTHPGLLVKTNELNEEYSTVDPDFEEEHLENQGIEDNDVILSVYWKRGKLGGAYYTCADSQIHLLNDITDVHPDFNNLKTFISQVNPSQIVTCSGMSDEFVETLTNSMNGLTNSAMESPTSDEEDHHRSPKIYFMSSRKRDLSYESCKRYIFGMRFGFEPRTLNEEDHILFIDFHMDLNKEAMVISMGMLVKYLEKYLPAVNLKHEPVTIMFVNHVSINNLVSIDDVTYKALQIFNPRAHPSAFMRSTIGSTREGLSLFAIFNRCKSKAGIKRMREIFLNPSKNIKMINERLDAVEFCSQPQHQHVVQNLLDCIKKVENISGILSNIYRTRASIANWRSLYGSLYNAILIGDICQRYSSQSSFLGKVSASITPEIYEVTHYMNQIIDFEQSTIRNHFTVRNGVDNDLDQLRETYAQIPDVLIKVAEMELNDLPSFIEECSIIYITELGYLLSVPIWKGDGSDTDDYTLPNFDVKFIVNNYVHYKTPRCTGKRTFYSLVFDFDNKVKVLKLDEVLGDSLASISNIESTIMVTLIQFIHARISDIVKVIKLVAELDCIISFAVVAFENNYRRPVLINERKINIIQGRHPLQELCVDNFVPNDTRFETDKNQVHILTGPNASGKSVYLKQVAIIAFLAHIGSFVPAQSAEICILDHIHSRIQTIESVATRMSAFLLDLKQMSYCIYNSTPNSLIVIDEFGKGTTEIDGLSLLAASLIHFIERGAKCPFLLVSTHFHTLPNLLPSTNLVNLNYMDYIIENDEIIYLHKIKEGVSKSSMTLFAAKAAGLSEDTIKRCLEIQSLKGPLTCNPSLKITQKMLSDISYMEKIFDLVTNKNEKKDCNENNPTTSKDSTNFTTQND